MKIARPLVQQAAKKTTTEEDLQAEEAEEAGEAASEGEGAVEGQRQQREERKVHDQHTNNAAPRTCQRPRIR